MPPTPSLCDADRRRILGKKLKIGRFLHFDTGKPGYLPPMFRRGLDDESNSCSHCGAAGSCCRAVMGDVDRRECRLDSACRAWTERCTPGRSLLWTLHRSAFQTTRLTTTGFRRDQCAPR